MVEQFFFSSCWEFFGQKNGDKSKHGNGVCATTKITKHFYLFFQRRINHMQWAMAFRGTFLRIVLVFVSFYSSCAQCILFHLRIWMDNNNHKSISRTFCNDTVIYWLNRSEWYLFLINVDPKKNSTCLLDACKYSSKWRIVVAQLTEQCNRFNFILFMTHFTDAERELLIQYYK